MEIDNAAKPPGNGDELKAKRRVFFDTLLAATRETPSERKPFATAGAIDGYLLGSLVVEGLPVELRLPLSPPGAAALRSVSTQAPHGQGLHTVLDPSVRRAWQLDASKVSFPNDPRFLTQIQEIATRAVKELEPESSLPVEAHLYKVLFYETGGHFKAHRDTEKEPGMFGTLVLQLPTHGGFQGGELVVSHRRETKVFNCTERASTRIYYTVFFADCEHALEPVRRGRRLCLSFNLVRRNAGNVVRESNFETPLFKKVEDVLRPWLEEADKEESNSKLYLTILAVPLQHKYTPTNLSFAGLKGEDADLCQVLVNCLERRLDVHLCLMTKREMGTPAGLGEFPRGKIRAPWTGVGYRMVNVWNKQIATSDWVAVDDQKLPIYPRYVDPKTEIVLGSEEKPFYKSPDEFKFKGFTGNEGPSLDYFYHRALVVIWPKSKAVATITESRRRPNDVYFGIRVLEDAEVLSLLNMVERLHKEKDRHAPLVLRQLLAHCEKKYHGIWECQDRYTEKVGCVSSRLLDMCIVAGDLADTLRVLKLHSEVFQVKNGSNGNPSHKAPWFIGLRTQFVCKSIAGAVHTHGWTACGEAVLLLLQKDRIIVEGEYYAQLAVELQLLGHPKEALLIATKTMKLVSGSERAQCHSQLLSSVVKMLCISEKWLQELSIEFTMWLSVMDITWIIQVLNELSASMLKGSVDERRTAVKQDSGIFLLFLGFFDILVARDFHSPVTEGLIVGLVHGFISLGDRKVLDSLMRPLLRQADLHPEQHCLKELLASDLLWNALVVDARGKDTLRALLEPRLAWLTSSPMPEFNWCQPFAQLPQHPTIEEFLRGPQRSLTYQLVSSLPEARKLALLFDGQYHNGYCATGTEGGRGAGAYCVIEKSRAAFAFVLNHWRQEQIEKKKLEDKLQIIRELCDGPGATVKQERVKEQDEIQAAEEAGVKRQSKGRTGMKFKLQKKQRSLAVLGFSRSLLIHLYITDIFCLENSSWCETDLITPHYFDMNTDSQLSLL